MTDTKSSAHELRCAADFLRDFGLLNTADTCAEAADEIERLRAIKRPIFENDPFAIVVEAYGLLWPNSPLPYIQWLPPNEIRKSSGPCGCLSYDADDDVEDMLISIDVSIPIYGAVEVLAHELAHFVCLHLGLDEEENREHGDNWQACFDAINDKYNELATHEAAEAAREKNQC